MAKGIRRLTTLAAAAVTAVALAAPAGAGIAPEPVGPQIRFVADTVVVRDNPDVALVIGSYRCFGGDPIHLWVSVKQGGPDPTAEGSGATSRAWYDTNIMAPPPVVCDGRWHGVRVNVGRYPDKEQLRSGRAWLQFCLVDNFGIVASESKWVKVVV